MSYLQAQLEDSPALRNAALVLLALGVGLVGGLAIVAGNPVVPFVALVALVALPWLVTRPIFDLGVVIGLVMLLPYAVVPVHLAIFTPTLLEIALMLMYVSWLLLFLLSGGRDGGLQRTPIDVWVLVFFAATGFAFILGLARDSSTDVIHNYAKLILAAGLFFAVGNLIRSTRTLAIIMRWLLLSGGISATLGVVLWRLPDTLASSLLTRLSIVGYPTDRVLRYVEDNPAEGERAIGTQVDPNSFGGLLMIITVITGVQFLARKPVLPRWLLGGMFLIEAAAVVLTQSRSALGGVVVGMLLVATLRYRRLWGWGVLLAGVALVIGAGSGYIARIVAGLHFEDQASLMRLAEYSNALDIIGRYPVFGVGFGTAGELDLTTGVSSLYLTIAERAGLISLLIFIVSMVIFLANTLPAVIASHQAAPPAAEDERSETWSVLDSTLLGCTAAMVGALVSVGPLDHFYFNIEFPHMVAIFWLALALALVARRLLLDEFINRQGAKDAKTRRGFIVGMGIK